MTYADKPWLKSYDFWVPETINPPHRPLYHILQLAASLYTDKPATHFFGAELSFIELKRQADRLAAALHRLGVRQGDRAGILLQNCPQYPIAFFAISRLGAIVVNINPAYTTEEIGRTVRDSGARILITQDTLLQTIAPIREIEQVVVTRLADYSQQTPAEPLLHPNWFSSLIEESDGSAPDIEIDPHDVAILQYTGGTTGVSKGAMLTHYSVYANVVQTSVLGTFLRRNGEGKVLFVLPYFHVYGLVIGQLSSLFHGFTQIPLPKYDPKLMIECLRTLRPTFVPGVPTLFISLLNHPDIESAGLEYVQSFNSGAAPLPVEVIHKFEKYTSAQVREGFGMTECSCSATGTPTLAKRKPGSVGVPIPSTEIKIVDLDSGTTEMPVGEDGELCLRGPQIMRGYWNQPEETAIALRDGWLYTGDIARMDEDGYLWIVQRKKDMINVGGFKVFPNEIEDVLFTHPAVAEAAAVGIPHPYRGEVVKAFVVKRSEVDAEALLAFCREHLAKFKVPTEIEFLDRLPKSAVGKVLRRELRR